MASTSETPPGPGLGLSTSTDERQSGKNTPTKDGESANDNGTGSSSDGALGGSAAAAEMPVRTKESFNRLMIERFQHRDAIAAANMHDEHKQRHRELAQMRDAVHEYKTILHGEYRPWFPPTRLYGQGYNGFGNGHTDVPQARIIYPSQKQRPGKRAVPPVKARRKDVQKQAEQHEELVPVRLEVEWEKIRLRDTFTWNLHERLCRPEHFAMQLLEDMGLQAQTSQHLYDQILQQMREQLNDFYPFAYLDEDALDPELPYSAYKNDEMRVLIKLNITIGQHTLVDQFEWEINNPSNSPEEFAISMCRDLSLSGEFITAIAHCIREQTQLFTRSLYSVGHPFDGRPVEDPDLITAFLQSPLPTVFRPQQQAKEYAPYLYELSDADLERNETIFSREQRRQKRSINRRGGPQLPDLKERQRTIRTLIVSSTLPGAAATVEESRLYKRTAPVGKKRPLRDGDLSESEDSEDSSPDSPAPSQLAQGGTARTRGMRGAASAAAQRMANLGRSETPDVFHHHETRTSRRFREETEEPQQLVVKLKVSNKDRLRRVMSGDYSDLRAVPQTPVPVPHSRAPSSSGRPMPPPPTPGSSSGSTLPPGQLGRIIAPPHVPGTEHPQEVSNQ